MMTTVATESQVLRLRGDSRATNPPPLISFEVIATLDIHLLMRTAWRFLAGIGGGGTVPSQDGSYAYSQDPSSGMAAGYLVYPSQSLFKLVVKG